MKHDIEIYAALIESMEVDLGLFGNGIVNFFADFLGNLDGYFFDKIQIAVIGHAAGNLDGHIRLRHAVVGDNGAGDFLVWHDYGVAGGGDDGRKAPGDVRYLSFLAGAEANIVIDAELLGHQEIDAGADIGEGFLQTEGDGHTADTHGSKQGGNGDAHGAENQQDAHGVDDDVDDVWQKAGLRNVLVALGAKFDKAGGGARHNLKQGKAQPGREYVGKEIGGCPVDIGRVDEPVERSADNPCPRQSSGGFENHIADGKLVLVKMPLQPVCNQAVDELPDTEGGEKDTDRNKEHIPDFLRRDILHRVDKIVNIK